MPFIDRMSLKHHLLTVSLAFVVCVAGCSSVSHAHECDQYIAQAHDSLVAHNYDRARELLAQAASEAEKSENAFSEAFVLREQAAVALADGKLQQCEEYSQKLLNLYDKMIAAEPNRLQRSALTEDWARAAVPLGDCLMAEKRDDEALKLFNTAHDRVGDAGGDLAIQAVLGNRIGAICKKQNKKDENLVLDETLERASEMKVKGARPSHR